MEHLRHGSRAANHSRSDPRFARKLDRLLHDGRSGYSSPPASLILFFLAEYSKLVGRLPSLDSSQCPQLCKIDFSTRQCRYRVERIQAIARWWYSLPASELDKARFQ